MLQNIQPSLTLSVPLNCPFYRSNVPQDTAPDVYETEDPVPSLSASPELLKHHPLFTLSTESRCRER